MLLEHLNMIDEANIIRIAVNASIENKIVTKDIAFDNKYYSTTEVGDWISNYILSYKN